MATTTKSIRFFIRMLPMFLAEVTPASISANPACMKKMSEALTRTQTVSMAGRSSTAVMGAGPFPRGVGGALGE
jgi:hypothetical protein